MSLPILMNAWKKLMLTFMFAYVASLLTGLVLMTMMDISPEIIFEMSTRRLAYALPVMNMGAEAGIDPGILLFVWNTVAALVTLSFVYTAALFNPTKIQNPPKVVRKIVCSGPRMKLLCFLPGCIKIKEESLRRLYVWLMVPYFGMILLGIEVGLSASTAKHIFGSHWIGFISLLPHGIIEIPAFAMAGAVPFSAHLLMKPLAHKDQISEVFRHVEDHRHGLPMLKIMVAVFISLLIAGLIEAHVTQAILENA